MAAEYVTTKLYEPANSIAIKYIAWVELNEKRTITKEQAVKELVLKGASGTLPADIMAEFSKQSKKK